jgi:hypothetical protein
MHADTLFWLWFLAGFVFVAVWALWCEGRRVRMPEFDPNARPAPEPISGAEINQALRQSGYRGHHPGDIK